MKKYVFMAMAAAMVFATGCSDDLYEDVEAGGVVQDMTRANGGVSTIDVGLNDFTDTLLASAIKRHDAYGGMIAVVETQTGRVRAASSMFHGRRSGMDCFHVAEYSTLGQIATAMAATENGSISMDDSVDTGCGTMDIHGRMLREHSWLRGGYGTLTLHDAIVFRSSIGAYLAAEDAFAGNITALTEAYRKIGYNIDLRSGHTGAEIDFAWTALGYNYKISSWNTLQFVNAIANDGKLVPLTMTMVVDSTEVEHPRIAQRKTVRAICSTFEDRRGFATRKIPVELKVGAMNATSLLVGDESPSNRKMEVCGYFPTDNPKYTVYICLYKDSYLFETVKLAKQLEDIAKYLNSAGL